MAPSIALLKSAGFGTRMGMYGNVLPKPLWPIFDMTQLDFHIWNLFELGVEKIYVNTHYMAEKVEKQLLSNKSNRVEAIRETQLLGSGGCFHNLNREKQLSEVIFATNVDVFFDLTKEDINVAETELKNEKDVSAYLYSIPVENADQYNRLVLQDGYLKDITQGPSSTHRQTYSGCALVDLAQLEDVPGKSNFFETVADYKQKKVRVEVKDVEYWDLGDLQNYLASHRELLRKKRGKFFEKLVRSGALEERHIFGVSYRAPRERRIINLSDLPAKILEKNNIYDSLIMPGTSRKELEEGCCEETEEGRIYYPRGKNLE